jgi:hypothetical protein
MVFGMRQLTANRKWRKPLLWRCSLHDLLPQLAALRTSLLEQLISSVGSIRALRDQPST